MNRTLMALTLAVQVTTVALFFSFSSDDTQAYPMEAGYVMKDQNLEVVYYDGTPAELTYEQLDAPIRKIAISGVPSYIKKVKNLKCERKDVDGQSAYRCALDLKKLPESGI